MKKVTPIIILAFISLFLFSCSNNDTVSETILLKNSDISLTYTPMENEIVNLINDYRTSKGLIKLNTFNIVSNEAIAHTNYMVETGEVSHANFGVRYQHLVVYAGAKSAAENVAYGYSTAQAVVNAWVNSEGHRHNIENTSFTDFGISTKRNSKGKYYFTNIFIKR